MRSTDVQVRGHYRNGSWVDAHTRGHPLSYEHIGAFEYPAPIVRTWHYQNEDVCSLTNCPKCGTLVYFVRHNGGAVWFDELGYPWPKHPCFADDKEGVLPQALSLTFNDPIYKIRAHFDNPADNGDNYGIIVSAEEYDTGYTNWKVLTLSRDLLTCDFGPSYDYIPSYYYCALFLATDQQRPLQHVPVSAIDPKKVLGQLVQLGRRGIHVNFGSGDEPAYVVLFGTQFLKETR